MSVIKTTIYQYICDTCGNVAEYPNDVRPAKDGWTVTGGDGRTPIARCPRCSSNLT